MACTPNDQKKSLITSGHRISELIFFNLNLSILFTEQTGTQKNQLRLLFPAII